MAQPVAAYTDAAEEHLATRRACGLFGFSFMGHFEIAGAGSRAFLDRLQTRNLAALAPGRIAYTLLLRADGTVFIDATVWRLAPRRDASSLRELPRVEVTSRVRSPSFGRELALGFAPAEAAASGTIVSIAGTERASVCRLPFFDPVRTLPRRRE
jgi:glycine cleavage system aminomethyltransferase T